MSQAKANKMGVVQLTIPDDGQHDGFRHHYAADQTSRSRDDLDYLLAGHRRRLNGAGLGLCKMRYV